MTERSQLRLSFSCDFGITWRSPDIRDASIVPQGKKLSDSTQQNLFQLTDYDEFEVESRKRSRPQSIVPFFRVATTYYIPPNTSKSIYCGRRAPITPTSTSDCAGLLSRLNTAMDKIPSELLASNDQPAAHQRDCVRAFLSELQQTAYDLAGQTEIIGLRRAWV
jgi:hypothetical protein